MEADITCSNPGCGRRIQSATAKRNQGLCGPCAGTVAVEERRAFIAANLREIDPFAGVEDPVALLRLVHEPRPPDPLIRWVLLKRSTESLYMEFDATQAAEMVRYAVAESARGRQQVGSDIAACLAAFTGFDLGAWQRHAIDTGSYWPSASFRGASAEIRDLLLQRVESDQLALAPLAWIGDDAVVDCFAAWRDRPPRWADRLPQPPGNFTLLAGWELTPGGRRRDLFSRACHALVPATNPQDPRVAMVDTAEQLQPCRWCGCRLSFLLDFRRVPREVSSGDFSPGGPVLTCTTCGAWGTRFGQLDDRGRAGWSDHNREPDWLPPGLQEDGFRWSVELTPGPQRSAFHASDWCLPTTFSQVGGHPTWIQEPGFPVCPSCGERMPFVGQVDLAQCTPPGDGMFYAFFCRTCRLTASGYQQT